MPKNPLKLDDGEQLAYFESGGSWCYIRTPESYKAARGKAVPLIIRCRGYGGFVRMGYTEWMERSGSKMTVDALVERGFAVAGSDLSGDHWGRPAGVAANVSLYNFLTENTNVDAARVGMFTGAGMGGTVLWNSVIGPLHGKVKSVVMMQAIVSLAGMFPAWRRNVMEAYSISLNTEDAVAIASLAQNDPLIQTQNLLATKGAAFARGLPEVYWLHGEKDKPVSYEANAVAMTRLLKKHGVACTLKGYKDKGHDLHLMPEEMTRLIAGFFVKTLA